MKRTLALILALCLLAMPLAACDKGGEPSAPASQGQSVSPSPSQSPSENGGINTSYYPDVTPIPQSHERVPRPAESSPSAAPNGETPAEITVLARDAALFGSLSVEDGLAGRFEQQNPDDKLEFAFDIVSEGFYALNFRSLSLGGEKQNNLAVDGNPSGSITTANSSVSDSIVHKIYLTAGRHTAAITSDWGWILVESLIISPETAESADYFVPVKLVNPKADDNALALMSFLCQNYGKTMLAGTQSQGNWASDNGLFGGESEYIFKLTGERPSVIALDFIDYTPSRVDKGRKSLETLRAIEAWENNAIVSFCWHWNAPTEYLTNEDQWGRGFYSENVQRGFLAKILNGSDPEGKELLNRDIDAIAIELKRLQDAGVPVLWRPLHEASGGWFWWGAEGAAVYKSLYLYLFNRLTVDHGLTNLIWVWNGQSADWYPGDKYVDIIGEDIYAAENDHSSQFSRFAKAKSYTKVRKIITLSETGVLVDPTLAQRDGAMWSWWATWNNEYVNSEKYTSFEKVKEFYKSDLVTTWAELPDLKNYPIYTD